MLDETFEIQFVFSFDDLHLAFSPFSSFFFWEEIDIRTKNSTSVFVDERREFRCFSYGPKILQLGKQDNFRGIFIDVQAFSLLSASRDRHFY